MVFSERVWSCVGSGATATSAVTHAVIPPAMWFPFLLQRDGVLALHHGSVSDGGGKGTARVLGIVTEIVEEVALVLLTGGVQGEQTTFKHEAFSVLRVPFFEFGCQNHASALLGKCLDTNF